MGTPTTYTGHPDWIPTSSTPIPVLAAEIGTFPAGTWGPEPVYVTSGGAYMITVAPAVAADYVITDITVQHYDFAGNLVFTDFYGAVIAGAAGSVLTGFAGPTVLRGNVYGSLLKISGQVATSAYLNAIAGQTLLVASNAVVNMYILPSTIGDPEPKMSNGSGYVDVTTRPVPGNLLLFFDNANVSASDSELNFCIPYSGPCVLNYDVSGAASVPSDFLIQLIYYTVVNGSGGYHTIPIQPTAVNTGYQMDLNMPACLCICKIVNNNGAQSETFNVSIIGQKSA